MRRDCGSSGFTSVEREGDVEVGRTNSGACSRIAAPRGPGRGGILLLLALLLASFPAAAQPYDAAVAGMSDGCRFAVDCCAQVQWIIDGVPGPTQPVMAVAAAPGGTVLGLIPRDDTFYVARVTPEGASAPVAVGPNGSWRPQTLVVARSGAMYVLAREGANTVVIAFNANGQITGTHPMPGAMSIDLAADQCTLWIAGGSAIRRYDVCTGTPLPGFLTGFTRAVRVLPDGGALVLDSGVKRYSAAGTLVRTYTFPTTSTMFGAIALADGGARGFAASNCFEELFSFDVESGVSAKVGRVALDGPSTIVPYLAWTAALGASHVRSVPTLSPALLIALAAFVALAASLRLWR